MKKLTKILSAILVIVLCVQIIAPGTLAIGATPFVGNNVAKSASEGISLHSQGDAFETAEIDAEIPVNDSSDENSDSKITTPILGEVEELRTENTKHYRHKDGTYTAAIYPEPIHYMDSTGSWQDIDNTLTLNSKRKSVAGKATYTPAASALDIRIPQDFSGGQMLTIGKDGYTVGMRIKTSDNSSAMSMSANATASRASSATAVIDNNFASMEAASVSSAADTSVSSDSAVELANKEEMKLDKKVSAVNYNDAFNGADLQYVITPSKVKENIIVTETQNSYVYQFELDLDGLIPVSQNNGSIRLYEDVEDEEALFVIETPYMYDANDETSFDVTMSLNGNNLTVTADPEWINDENRVFPVVIDPTLSTAASTFHDATANQNTPIMNFDSYMYLYAGSNNLNVRRAYLKFDLPHLPDGSVVTDATFQIVQHDVELANISTKLIAFDLSKKATWSDTSLTWSNQPLSKEKNGPLNDPNLKKIDYEIFKFANADGQVYSFNLTKTVKNWYEGTVNNGIMLTSSNEKESSQATIYSSDHDNSSLHPSVTIEYTNNIGLEDYWTYETRDLGRSGTVYANPYNGSITYLHSDLKMTGNLLPINVSHVYNSNNDGVYDTYYYNMSVGEKFHLNLQQLLIPITSLDSMYDKGYRFKYYDGDGTMHLFKQIQTSSGENKIVHEYDPKTYISFERFYYIISFSDGSKKYFFDNGYLFKIVDKNGNAQKITLYQDRVTRVADPSGREARFSYNQKNQLESITDPSGRTISFAYSNETYEGKLISITYSDGNQTLISYTADGYLDSLTAVDNSHLSFNYNDVAQGGHRISTIDPYDKNNTQIDHINFSYSVENESGIASGNTVISNNNNELKEYLFDKYGRATSVTNQHGQSRYSIYGNDAVNSSDTFNKLLSSSDLLTISGNLLKNHGFENDDYWAVLQNASTGICNYSTEQSSKGYRSVVMELSENAGVYEVGQDFSAVAGEEYTVSLDVYIPEKLNVSNDNGVLFGFVYCLDGVWHTESGKWLTSTSGWERFSHTISIPDGTLTACRVFIELARAKGKVYFDSIQVEKSAGARYYNLVENSDFSNTPAVTNGGNASGATAYSWTTDNIQSGDGVYTVGGRNYVLMSGSPDKRKQIKQIIPINASSGDTMIIGGRAGAYATDGDNDGRCFNIIVEFYSADNSCFETLTIDFDRSVNQSHQTKASVFRLTKDCHHIVYSFNYFYHIDGVSFDDAFVYLDRYGEHYEYENGLLNTIYDDEGKTTIYDYPTADDNSNNDNDISAIKEKVSGVEQTVATYSYDSNHNVTEATNNIGTTIEYEYLAGQVTKQTTKYTNDNNQEKKIVESFSYYQGGNYLKAFTDETGGVTTYYYDYDDPNAVHDPETEYEPVITKGLVTSVRDPNGNITSYTYDPNTDELISVSGNAEPSVPSTVNFTYENGLPKTITRNGTTYSYAYDAQNRVTSSKVGTQTLTTNSYDSRQRLSQVAYANSAVYTPVYDSRDRLAGDSWNGNQISEYYYNENDRLSKHVDNITDVSYQYDYAFYGLPFRITGSDGTQTTFDYDKSGTLARLTFGDENDTIYSGKYYTNEKGKPEDVLIDTLDNAVLHYNYDGFGRVEDCSYGPMVRTYQYAETSLEGNTVESNKVIEIVDKNKNDRYIQKYDYEYNEDGSLYCYDDIVKREYYDFIYDDLGRVIENYLNGDLLEYNYDAEGNLSTVIYNLDVLHTYTYGNQNWKDQLTAFDGKAITYDANGNPLTYDGYTYSWQRGTQLASITGNGKNISYVYDSQGHRVQKTVNGVTTSYLYSGDLLMRQTDGTNTLDFQYDASGYMVGFVYNGTPYYYLRNVLNDISGIVDGEGTVVARYVYDAYGNTVLATGSMAAINPIRYRGYYFDSETNWYYLESRYYNPEWCRFISPDCLFVAGDVVTGSNMYAYCNNNPVTYADPSGMVSQKGEIIGNSIRVASKITSWVLLPATTLVVAPISNMLLDEIKGKLGDNPIESEIGEVVVSALDYGAHEALGKFTTPISGNTFDVPTGLRHFMPVNMAFGAPWAAYFLGFEEDENCPSVFTAYTTVAGKKMWQSRVGYDSVYDTAFSLGGPIFRRRYRFTTGSGQNTKYYVVWIWKGDYWNLGAGAEIGIYAAKNQEQHENDFYEVDENLVLDVNMVINYRTLGGLLPITLNNLTQRNWWVCSFSPAIQHPNVRWIDVSVKANFVDNAGYDSDLLMNGFYQKALLRQTDYNDWKEISWAPTQRKANRSEYCDRHPTECICNDSPCCEYSDNGYQFYIEYTESEEQ